MADRTTPATGGNAYVSVEELLTIVAYFAESRSVMEAATELAISYERIVEILEQLAATEQPSLFGVQAFEIDRPSHFDVRIRPKATLLTQPRALTAEETATLLLILETIEDAAAPAASEAARSAALKLRAALGKTVPIIDSAAANDGEAFAFADPIYEALHNQKVLRIRYRNASGKVAIRELDCVNVYTVESTTYLRAVDRDQAVPPGQEAAQKSFRVDRIEAAEVLDTRAGVHQPAPVDIRNPHAFGDEHGASAWASVFIDAADTWIADYEPVFFTGAEVSATEKSPAGFVADVPMSNMAATVAFILRRSPSVKVLEPGELRDAVVLRAADALTEYSRNDKT